MEPDRGTKLSRSSGTKPHAIAAAGQLDGDSVRLLVESTVDYAIFMLDPAGLVATWNKGAERITGYQAEEIVGQHVSIFRTSGGNARRESAHNLDVAAAEGRVEEEGWRVRKDGTEFWANVITTALRDGRGHLVGFGQVCRDLTDRRRAEQQLRESEERFRMVVESTIDYAIFMLDPSGHVASWNAGAERIKGYAPHEIIGKHFSTFYERGAVDRGWPDYELKEAARVGRFEDEGWRLRKDGTRFWANVVITALRGNDGTLRGFAKVTRDLTQRKAHEERIASLTRELEARVADLAAVNRELAQRNTENESFVYSVSHDLRAPLVNLQGFSQELTIASTALTRLLEQPTVPSDVRSEARTLIDGDLHESIGFIRNAVNHLGNIIDGLLRLSRVGRVEYESEPVDTDALVSDIISAMHTQIIASGARLDVRPLPVVTGDRNAIGQVFANLIGNALKSFDPDRPGVIEIAANSADPPVFAVRDNGVGIPDEYRSKIFQVFQQVHSGRGGEGMGLAIVRRIVERHGGRIWFESKQDEGTTFYFTLTPDAAAPTSEPA